MRDPHRFLRTILYVLTPIGYAIAVGWHAARIIRDMTRKGTR